MSTASASSAGRWTRTIGEATPRLKMFDATRDALDDGSVVLAHDGVGPGALRDDAEETVAYVGLVAEHARHHGLVLEALA